MQTTEKEINCNLFDKLDLLEDIERVAKTTDAKEVLELIAVKKEQIERKLYYQPLLSRGS